MSIMVGMSKAPPKVAAPMMSMSEDGATKEENEEEDEEKNPFVLLKDASGSDLILGILALPISVSLWLFVPDWCVVRNGRGGHRSLLTILPPHHSSSHIRPF